MSQYGFTANLIEDKRKLRQCTEGTHSSEPQKVHTTGESATIM